MNRCMGFGRSSTVPGPLHTSCTSTSANSRAVGWLTASAPPSTAGMRLRLILVRKPSASRSAILARPARTASSRSGRRSRFAAAARRGGHRPPPARWSRPSWAARRSRARPRSRHRSRRRGEARRRPRFHSRHDEPGAGSPIPVATEPLGVVHAVQVDEDLRSESLELRRQERCDSVGRRAIRDREDLRVAHAQRERRHERGRRCAVHPPSTTRECPVIHAASSLARKTAGPVMSSGVPTRRRGKPTAT